MQKFWVYIHIHWINLFIGDESVWLCVLSIQGRVLCWFYVFFFSFNWAANEGNINTKPFIDWFTLRTDDCRLFSIFLLNHRPKYIIEKNACVIVKSVLARHLIWHNFSQYDAIWNANRTRTNITAELLALAIGVDASTKKSTGIVVCARTKWNNG